MSRRSAIVVGGGAYGLAAARTLSDRGHAVTLLDPGPIPHPEASSTDISKAVRADYGADAFHAELAEHAMERWQQWNAAWSEPLFHHVGFLMMASREVREGDFEFDGYTLLAGKGWPVERIGAEELTRRFPVWSTGRYVDGYYNPRAGYAESGRVISWLAERARDEGVTVREGTRVTSLAEDDNRVTGVVLHSGETIEADTVIVAAGAWTARLLPWLEPVMWAAGQPVLHFGPEDPAPFQAERFPVWAADISTTGWYGFPATKDGLVKIGNHGPGRRMDPDGPKVIDPSVEPACREFLSHTFPALAEAPVVSTRLCMYGDTFDGDFWIDRDPERPGLVVAAGGSGHGFKFVPVLGDIVADVVEEQPNRWASRFRWRQPAERRAEQARHLGDEATR